MKSPFGEGNSPHSTMTAKNTAPSPHAVLEQDCKLLLFAGGLSTLQGFAEDMCKPQDRSSLSWVSCSLQLCPLWVMHRHSWTCLWSCGQLEGAPGPCPFPCCIALVAVLLCGLFLCILFFYDRGKKKHTKGQPTQGAVGSIF